MKLKNKTNTPAAVTYPARPYNAGLAHYSHLVLTASTLSEKCSIRQYDRIWWILNVFDLLLFFTT